MNHKKRLYFQRKKRHNCKAKAMSILHRCVVKKSNAHIYAQIVNQDNGDVVVASSDLTYKEDDKTCKVDLAYKVGEELGAKLQEKGITRLVFDRNGYIYHGRVKAVCEGLRSQDISV